MNFLSEASKRATQESNKSCRRRGVGGHRRSGPRRPPGALVRASPGASGARMSAYGTPPPSPSPYGRAGAPSREQPADARLRAALRKAFLDIEGALSDWDEADRQGVEVLRALVNAGDRLRDFTAARGELGVLSGIPGAEDALRARLIRSMERLHAALQPPVASQLAAACERLERVVHDALAHSLQLHAACDVDSLWDSAYRGQPSIAEMEEWLQDCLLALRRELALREELLCDVGSEEGLARALDLWEARTWYDPEHLRARLDTVRIHGAAAT
jgi:hypothetical protein